MDTPKKIYLCQDEDDVYESAISWCEDPAGDENVTYIRADVVAERLDALLEIALEGAGLPNSDCYWQGYKSACRKLEVAIDTARRDLLGSEAKEGGSNATN